MTSPSSRRQGFCKKWWFDEVYIVMSNMVYILCKVYITVYIYIYIYIYIAIIYIYVYIYIYIYIYISI